MAIPITIEDTASDGIPFMNDAETTSLDEARQTLAAYFMFSTTNGADMPNSAILAVLQASRKSSKSAFEQLMLEISSHCDERIDNSSDAGKTAHKNFLRLIEILQQMDEASKHINKLVFFASGIPDIATLTMLSTTWDNLTNIKPGLFRELLTEDLLACDLIGRIGHRRLIALLEGLEQLSAGAETIQGIQKHLERLEHEEQIVVRVVTAIQNVIGNRFGWVAGDGERETIKRIVSIELRHQRLLKGDIPDRLFDVGLKLAKSSLMYINTLLPIIISQGDTRLREEFIRDSGLDRLLVEKLEEHWCAQENIPHNRLAPIRKNPSSRR